MFPPLKNKIMSYLFRTYYCYFRNHDLKLWIQCKKSKCMFFVHNSVWILVIIQNKILWEPLKNVVWLNVFKNCILIIMYESTQLNNIYFWLGDVIGDYFMSFSKTTTFLSLLYYGRLSVCLLFSLKLSTFFSLTHNMSY